MSRRKIITGGERLHRLPDMTSLDTYASELTAFGWDLTRE